MENAYTRLQYKVGLFVAIGLLVAMGSILALGGNRVFFTRYKTLKTEFSHVQGLFPGSVVSLAGLPVGNVKSISFGSKDNLLEVILQIDRKFGDRVHEGTTAEIRTQGALGDKYVYLEPGPVDKPVLPDDAYINPIDDGDFLKLLTSKEDGIGRVLDLIKEVHTLVADLNANGRVKETARNMAEASEQLKSTLAKLDLFLGDLRGQLPDNKKFKQAVTSLASVMEKIDSGKGTLGALINDPSVHQNLKAMLGGSPRNRYLKEMVRETIQRSEDAGK